MLLLIPFCCRPPPAGKGLRDWAIAFTRPCAVRLPLLVFSLIYLNSKHSLCYWLKSFLRVLELRSRLLGPVLDFQDLDMLIALSTLRVSRRSQSCVAPTLLYGTPWRRGCVSS